MVPAVVRASDGIHYYRPKPYVLVTETQAAADAGPLACVEIKYLPDYSQEYVIVPHYWIGSVALSQPLLTDGTLRTLIPP